MSKLEKILEFAIQSRQTEPVHEKVLTTSQIKQVEFGRLHPHVTAATLPDSPINEEYRKLKSWLVRTANKHNWSTFVVTSAEEEAGKTLTSINLSMMLAKEPNNSVLLVDADMRQRRSTIESYLSLKSDKGLSDYLDASIELSDILVQTSWENLFIIPSGTSHANPSEILPDQYVSRLIRDIKRLNVSRYVLIDTPPVLLFADPVTFGLYVDGVIFVVSEGKTPIKKVQSALNNLKDCNVIGVVFNNASIDPLDSKYKYYYQYKNT
jgi:capsular exopolysaccharide synthesis family protein